MREVFCSAALCAASAFASTAWAQDAPPQQGAAYPPPGSAPAQYGPPPGYPAQPGYAPGYGPPPGYGAPGYAPQPAYPPPGYGYGYGYGAPPAGAERPAARKKPPPAPARGFQLGLRLGIAIPLGLASDARGDVLNERYAAQFGLETELGAKLSDALFLGGYIGFGFGAEGRDERIEDFCDDRSNDGDNDIECGVVGIRLGLLGRWSFSPGESINPWLAYGIGYEGQSQSINDRVTRRRETTLTSGIEFARLSAGFDWRAGKTFGMGPVLEGALGTYTHSSTEVNGETTFDGDVENTAIHTWVTVAFRGVFFP